MTNKDMEKYYFYRLYSIDLDSTKHSLRVLKRYRRNDVRYCLLKEIVVSYARSFSENKGQDIPKHMLTKKVVPKNFRPPHDELINLRNQLFAHTDYTYRKPKVTNWSTASHKWFPMSFRGYDYAKLDSRVPEIENLVKSVENNLQSKIDEIEDKIQQSGQPDAKERGHFHQTPGRRWLPNG